MVIKVPVVNNVDVLYLWVIVVIIYTDVVRYVIIYCAGGVVELVGELELIDDRVVEYVLLLRDNRVKPHINLGITSIIWISINIDIAVVARESVRLVDSFF